MSPSDIWFYERIHCRINQQCSPERQEKILLKKFSLYNFPALTQSKVCQFHTQASSIFSLLVHVTLQLISFPEPVNCACVHAKLFQSCLTLRDPTRLNCINPKTTRGTHKVD